MSRVTIASLSSDIATEADGPIATLRICAGTATPFAPIATVINVHPIAAKNGVSRKTRKCRPERTAGVEVPGCGKQFSVLTGTILHGTKVPVRTWDPCVL